MMLAAGMLAANAAVETTYTYNFEEQVWSEAGVQNLGGINWDLQASFTKEVFFGWDTFNDKGQQIGSGSNPASSVTLATSGLSGTIKNVTVETSGFSAVFPAGLFVGRVKKIENSEDGLSYRLQVNLGTDFARLREVCVLTSPNRVEIDSLQRQVELGK